MVTLMDVYDAFLSKVNEDDWSHCYSEDDLAWFIKDWRAFLNSALPYFRFPRCRLDIDEATQTFTDPKMGPEEVQILATFMTQEWLKRTVDSWENIKTQYDESDFSQANLLKEFIALKDQGNEEARHLESIYSRSVNKKPFKYSKLAGGKRGRQIRR